MKSSTSGTSTEEDAETTIFATEVPTVDTSLLRIIINHLLLESQCDTGSEYSWYLLLIVEARNERENIF